jgi:hypothetical protein
MRSGVLSFAKLSLAADPNDGDYQSLQCYTSRTGIALTFLNGSAMTVC